MSQDKNNPDNIFFMMPDSFQGFMDQTAEPIIEASIPDTKRVTRKVENSLSINELRDKYDHQIPVYVLAEWLAHRLPENSFPELPDYDQ